MNDQRVRGRHVKEDFGIETIRTKYSDEQLLDMMAQLARSCMPDQSAMSFVSAVLNSVPIGRVGEVEEVDHAVVFRAAWMLTECSDELLSRHLIGAQALPTGDDAPCHQNNSPICCS